MLRKFLLTAAAAIGVWITPVDTAMAAWPERPISILIPWVLAAEPTSLRAHSRLCWKEN